MKKAIMAALALGLSGCATTYTAPDFEEYRASHETVAILPFDVAINASTQGKNAPSQEELDAIEAQQAEIFQRALYVQFLEKQERGRYTVDIQDIDETNVRLSRLEQSGAAMTKAETAKLIGVDAVVSGKMSLSKPMGTGWAVATTLLLGFGATNSGIVHMTVHEGEGGKLMWSYEHELSGGVMSSPESVAKALMGGIANKFPYRK
ncbi:MAG: hypothetical protein OXP28_17275 [Gammaproteobacteria bacterium]|nr:hypothetical protein [Gammaproteobacteria bacterium]